VLLRKEEKAIQFRTVANLVEREGKYISEQRSKKAEEILKRYGFDVEGKKIPGAKGDTGANGYNSLVEEYTRKTISGALN
jgi:hypothetical protein